MTFFTNFFAAIDGKVDDFIYQTAERVINWANPVFTSLLIVYIALWGISHLRGQVQETLREGVGRVFKIALIMVIALKITNYVPVVVNFLYEGPVQLAKVATGTDPAYSVLDNLIDKGIDLSSVAWKNGGVFDDFGLYIIGALIWILISILTAYCAFLFLLSKVALAILLSIGPILIMMTLFSSTQKFFEAWLGQVVNYGLISVLAVLVVQLIISMFDGYLASITSKAAAANNVTVEQFLPLAAMSCVSFLVLTQVTSTAAAMSGGFALSTQGFVSATLNRINRGASALRPTNVRRSYRSAMADARLGARGVGKVGGGVVKAMGAPGMAVHAVSKLAQRRFNRR